MNTPNKEEEKKAVLKGERRRIIEQLREEVRAGVKVDWLRSEIEKLESDKKKHWVFECNGPRPNKTTKFEDFCNDPECRSTDNIQVQAYNQALTSIITRYKEELKVLESK